MGQTQPTVRKSMSRYSTKSVFENAEVDYVQDDGLCCLYKIRRPLNKNHAWNEYLIKELSELTLEKWPLILKNHIEMHHDTIGDSRFRENLVNVKLSQYQRQTFIESVKPKPYQEKRRTGVNASLGENEGKEGVVVTCRMLNKNDVQDMSGAIKNLFEASGILEEKFLASCYQEIFEPRMMEDRGKLNMSMAMSDDSRYSDEMNISRQLGMNISGAKSVVSNKKLQSYRNNTVINQIGPNYQEKKNPLEDIDIKEMENCFLYYKQITANIEKHLKNERNIFKQLIDLFEKYLIDEYQKKADKMENMGTFTNEMSSIIRRATTDIQEFTALLYNGINLFYNLEELPSGKLAPDYSIFSEDNMSNFLTTLLFNEKIYNLIFQLYEIENRPIETSYRAQIEKLQQLNPQDFDVADEYCLNERTIEYFRNKGVNIRKKSRDDGKIYQRPYKTASECLKELSHQRSPIHKSKVLLKAVEQIPIAIDEFYQEYNIKNAKNLAGEHVFTILCYVNAQSGLKSIFSHCRIVNEFSTSNVRSSMAGYYTSTLEICTKYISNMLLKNSSCEKKH